MLNVFILALIGAQALAGPVGQYQPGSCARFCSPTSKFIYEIGHTYEYEYDLENVIGIDNEEESSRWHMTATVLITPQTTCEFTMQLRNVNVEGETGSLAADLERYPIAFAFQDGRIEEVCPSSSENSEVLNMKRGILSAMQNTMNNFEADHTVNEVDVNGDCSATYTIHTTFWGGTVTIEKTKDLNACRQRSDHMAGMHGIGYHVESDYQGIPLIKSTHNCKQEISDHHLHTSTCEETHTLRPFSGENSGATSKSKQILKFKQKTNPQIVPNVEMGEKTGLLFNHMAESEDDSTLKVTTLQLLTQLTEESENQVTPVLANKFSHLVSTLRKLSFSSIRGVYRKASQNRRMKSFLMDALPVVGTGPSISMMHEAILTGEVSEDEANSWYTSLAFTTRPNEDMLEAALQLIASPAPKQALLGVSAMVNKFCSLHSNCEETREVKAVLRRIESLVGSGCRTVTQEDEDNVMVALKAIGNAGRTTNLNILNQCFLEETNSMRVRVAALQAFRRLPCSNPLPEEVLNLYQDTLVDTELRINAYLTAMQCPTHDTVETVKETLSSEPVNQVGSFVWTHLTNLQETSDPTKAQAKELIGDDFLKNKFTTNALKHSRNYEVSLFSEEWNIGSLVESNVIFSQSPIPKSMNYNFTVNLFGESFNLFEIGGRAEGVESFFEKFFGPNGYYPEEHIANILSAMKGKRKTDDDVGRMSSEEVNPRLDGFLRVFGNELAFGSVSKLEDIQDMFGGMEPLRKMVRQFMNKKEIDYSKSKHFINAQFTVPTSAGLPLSIDVNGTALLRLQAKADLKTTDRINQFSGHIKPSAAVEVTTLMSVEAGKVKTGVQVMATMHTSTILDGGFNFEQGKIVNVHLNVPRDRQEIINVNSRVFVVNAQEKKEILGNADSKMEYQLCSGEMTTKALGMQLCGDVRVDTGFPLRGPAHAAIYLEKTDDFSQYMFEINRADNKDYSSYAITLDTPNSRVNRRQAAQLALDFGARNINGQLDTPFATFGVTGQYVYEPHQKVFDLKSTANGKEMLNIRASLDSTHQTRRGNLWTTRPQLKVDVYGTNVVEIKSSMEHTDSGKSSIDGIVESVFLREPITLKGNLNSDGLKHTAGLNMKTPIFEGEASGILNPGRASISGTYQIQGYDKENFEVMAKVAVSEGREKEFNGNAKVKLSALPVLNTDVEFTGTITPESFNSRIKFEGALNFEAGSKLALVRKSTMNDIQVQVSLTCPKTQSEYALQFSHQGTEETTTTKLSTHTSNSYDIILSTQFTHKRSPVHYGADVLFQTPEKTTKFSGKIIQSSPSDMEAELDTQWGDENRMKASGKITNLENNKQLSLMVKLPRGDPIRMTGAISRKGTSFAAMAQAEYLGEQYASSLDYLHTRREHQLVAKVKTPRENHELHLLGIFTHPMKKVTMDVKSYKHVSASFTWSPTSSTLVDGKLHWDKSNDPTQMLSFKIQNEKPSWIFTGQFLTHSITAECSLTGTNFFGRVAWGGDKEVVADVTSSNKETVAILKTPFQGFESQSLKILSEIESNRLKAEVQATWGSNQKFEVKLNGSRESTSSTQQRKGSIEVECTVCPFLNGFSADYQDELSPDKIQLNAVMVLQGKTYKGLYTVTSRRSHHGLSMDGQLELVSPTARASGSYILEYTADNFHYKEQLSIPYIANHDFEMTVKSEVDGRKSTVDCEVSYTNSFIKPSHLSIHLENEGPSVILTTTLNYETHNIFDANISGRFVSAGSINGKVDVIFYDDLFTGSFDHMVSYGQNSVISTRVTGKLNGKEVEIHVDGQYSVGSRDHEMVLDASMLSSWEDYNDLRMNLKHSLEGNRYHTTLTASRGNASASVSQYLTFQSLKNFEHKLSVSSPYDNVKYVTLDTTQKWDDTDFVHNTEGSWQDKSIATSAYFKQISSSNERKITGDVRVETPLTDPIKAHFNHNFDGQRYSPALSIDYADSNLISIEASGHFGFKDGNGKLIITPSTGDAIELNTSYDLEQLNTNAEASVSVKYGNHWRWELKERFYEEDNFKNYRVYLNTNGDETDVHFKHSFSHERIAAQVALSTPFMADVRVSGLLESSNRNHGLKLTALYAERTYEIVARAITRMLGDITFSLKTPSTNLSATVDYNFADDEKVINGAFANDKDRVDCSIHFKANKRGGSLQASVKSPFEGFKKLLLNSSFSNGHKNKKMRFHAQKEQDIIDLKGKVVFDTIGEVYFAAASPFEGFNSFKLKGHYNFDAEEKTLHVSGDSDSLNIELDIKGKVSPSESYIIAEMRSPQLGKQSFRIHVICEPNSMSLVGDWNGERMEVTGSYEERSFEVTAHFQDQVISLNGSYDTKFAKLGLLANSERLEASAEFDSFHAQLTLQRNNKKIKFELSTDPTSMNASVATPFKGYEHISFKSRWSASLEDRSITFNLMQGENILLYGSLQTQPISITSTTLSGKLSLPVLKTEMSATAGYNVGSLSKTANIVIEKNGQKIIAEITADLGTNLSEIRSTFSSPFEMLHHVYGACLLEHGDGHSTLTLSSNINGVTSEYKINVFYGANQVSLTVETPIEGFQTLSVVLEYESTSTRKYTKVTLGINEEIQEFSIGGQYEDGTAETSVYINTPQYKRSVQGRVRRSLDFMFRESYSDLTESRVIEISGDLAILESEVKGHFKVITPFTGWEYSEALLNVSSIKYSKFVNLEFSNGEKTHKVSGEFLNNENKFEVTLDTTMEHLEKIHAYVEHELYAREKILKIGFIQGEYVARIDLTGEFSQKKSEMQIDTVYFGNENKFTANYDFTGPDKQLFYEHVHDAEVKEKANVELSLPKGFLKINAQCMHHSPGHTFDLDYSFATPVKTVSINAEIDGEYHFVEGSFAIKEKEFLGILESSFKNYENLKGKITYDFSENRKNANIEFTRGDSKFEVHGDIQHHGHSTEVKGSIETPFPDYGELKFESTATGGSKPTLEIKFQCPHHHFESIVSYKVEMLQSELLIDVDTDLIDNGKMKVEGTYDIKSETKTADVTVTLDDAVHTFSTELTYEGRLTNGVASVKGTSSFLGDFNLSLETDLHKAEESTVTITYLETVVRFNAKLHKNDGYLKSYFNNHAMHDLTWTMKCDDGETILRSRYEDSGQLMFDLDIQASHQTFADVKWSVEITGPYCPLRNEFDFDSLQTLKLAGGWLFHGLNKFNVNVDALVHENTIKFEVDGQFEKQESHIKAELSGVTGDDLELEVEYTLAENQIKVELEIPTLPEIEIECSYFTVDDHSYDIIVMSKMASHEINIESSLSLHETEIKARSKVNLPFEGFEELVATIEIEPLEQNQDFHLLAQLKKNEALISFEEYLSVNESDIKYSFHIITPFAGYESMKFSSNFKNTPEIMHVEATFETDVTTTGKITLTNHNEKEKRLYAEFVAPYFHHDLVTFDATFAYDEKLKKPTVSIKLDVDGSMYEMKCHGYAYDDMVGGQIDIETPLNDFKKLFFETRYSMRESHKLNVLLKQNEVAHLVVSGILNVTPTDGNTNIDIATSCKEISHIKFDGMYDIGGLQKHISGKMNINDNSPMQFTAIWSYDSPVFIKVTLTTPFENPNFTLTIESDLEKENKHALIKYESGEEYYELKFSRNVGGSQSSNAIVISTPLQGYEKTSFKWTTNKDSFDATADYAGKQIKFTFDYSVKDDTYTANATLFTPFSSWETVKLRTYCKTQTDFLATVSFTRENEKSELVVESNVNRFLVKINSPYSPFNNLTVDIKTNYTNGYELDGLFGWEETKMEFDVLLQDNSLKVNFDSPFEPFKDVQLEGSLKENDNEYTLEGFGKWEEEKVGISGSWLLYEEFGVKTTLEIETPISGYEKSTVHVDIKKPVSHQGVEAKIEVNIPLFDIQSILFSLKHDGLTDVDIQFTGDHFKSSFSYKITQNVALGETELSVQGSLPLENLSKFSFLGKLTAPSNDNIHVQLELHTPSGVNQIKGHFENKDNGVAVEVKLELPLFLGLSPVSFSFDLKRQTSTNINLTGVLLLPHKTHEVHTSFVLENSTLKVLFKETGLYNVAFELDSTFSEGISFDVSARCPSETHNLQATFTDTDTGFEIRSSVTSPLLSHPASLKLSATYLSSRIEFASNIDAGGKLYKMKVDLGVLDHKYTGEVDIQVDHTQMVHIKCNYEPVTGGITLKLPHSEHELKFSITSEEKKTTVNISGSSPYITGGKFETVLLVKSDKPVYNVNLKVVLGSSIHRFILSKIQSKVELEIETPYLSTGKVHLVANWDQRENSVNGEISLSLGDTHHSIKASVNRFLNSDIRVNTTWLSQHEIHVLTKYENVNQEYIMSELSYRNGDEMFDLKVKYDFSDTTYCQASIAFSSSVEGYESIKLSGHYKHADVNEVGLKLEADDRYMPTFTLKAEYTVTSSLVNVTVNLNSSFTETQDLGFYMSLSPTNKNKQKIVVTGPQVKFELLFDTHFYEDSFDISLDTKLNDKIIVASVSAMYENPLHLNVHIETPFEGYEHLRYNGKLFWKLEEAESDYRRYVTGIEWNEKLIEASVSFTPGKHLAFDLTTPFIGYESISLKIERDNFSDGQHLTVSLKNYFFIYLDWGFQITFMKDENTNAYSGSVKFDDTYGNYSFLLRQSSTIAKNKFSGRYEVSGFGTHEIYFVEASLKDGKAKLALADKASDVLKVTLNIDTEKQVYDGRFNLREVPSLFTHHSGKFFISPTFSDHSKEWGVSLKFDKEDVFAAKIVLEDKKTSLVLANPFYPVSLHYTYDSSPNTFHVRGELCWDMDNKLHSTAGGELYLTNDLVNGKHVSAKVAVPGHHLTLNASYNDAVPGTVKHALNVGDNDTSFGYQIEIEQVMVGSEYENRLHCKIDTPHYPLELSGNLRFEGISKINGNLILDVTERSEFSFKYHMTSNHVAEGEIYLQSSLLSFHSRAAAHLCFDCGDTDYVEIEHNGATLLKLRATVVSRNTWYGEAESDFYAFPFSVSVENEGSTEGFHHLKVKYDLKGLSCHGEYFGELKYDYSHIRFGKTNRFLVEGKVEPWEEGHRVDVKAEEGGHEYHGSVLVDGNPLFVKMDAKTDAQSLMTAQFDATDLLSTKIFIQPSLFFNVQDTLSYYL